MPMIPPMDDEEHEAYMMRCMEAGETEAVCHAWWLEYNGQHAIGLQRKQEDNRAYSTINIKSVIEDTRTIDGIASTPTVDRMGDVVEPMGAKFTLPMPLLYQHNTHDPVGWVEAAEATEKGISFRARFAKVDDPGSLKDSVDRAWQSVKHKLVRAVSIGFKIRDHEPLDAKNPFGGWKIKDWEWLELSLVTIPANMDASIVNIRSIDAGLRAAAGQHVQQSITQTSAGASAQKTTPTVTAPKEAKQMTTYTEQIASFEAARAAKAARMEAIQKAVSDGGRTKDETEREEFDTLDREIKSIDDELVDLRKLEKAASQQAKPVNGGTSKEGSESRSVQPVRVEVLGDRIPKGIRFTRLLRAKAIAHLDQLNPGDVAEKMFPDTPEVALVLRTPVSAGTTTNSTFAEPLVQAQNMASEFVDLLRSATIIGRIPGLRRVPFNIKVPRMTSGASVNWIGETKVKPISSAAFDSLTLGFAKIAGIVPLSEELIRFSNPSAEALIRDDLAAAVVALMDRDFVDPSKAVATGVSPASITNGVTPVDATGTNEAALRADVRTLMATFLSNNLSLAGAVWIMTEQQAMSIAMMQTSLGQTAYPGLTAQGGTFLGIPVVTSENIPLAATSPANAGSLIILLVPNEILLADDGGVDVSISREASLQMDTAPDSPPTASTVMVSLWQHNMVAVKAERFVNWTKRRATAVGFIRFAKYAE